MWWRQRRLRWLTLLLALTAINATAATERLAAIALIIDDIGYQLDNDSHAISLPGPISYAVLPHTPHARRMARLAFSLNKDVLVHIPMEADHGNHLLGPGALHRAMSQQDFIETIRTDIAAVPYAVGISNHMGSRLTTDSRAMQWLMSALEATDLFYIDSYTSANSVADVSAARHRVPYLRRDVFLDNRRDEQAIRAQFSRLVDIARQKGHAIGIGHPYPETIAVLKQLLPQLKAEQVELVSIRELFNASRQEVTSWQQSSWSRWHRVVKNSKP